MLVLFSYCTDGALLLQQATGVGLKGKILAASSCYSNQFLKLGGAAVDGTVMSVLFFPGNPSPDIQRFVKAYEQRYHELPDQYAARAYDAVEILAWATADGGPTREGIRDALKNGTEIPSLLFGQFRFYTIRRVAHYNEELITVKDDRFVHYG